MLRQLSPICNKLKIFISSLKSPTCRDFIKIQEIKISHLDTFKVKSFFAIFSQNLAKFNVTFIQIKVPNKNKNVSSLKNIFSIG